MSTKTSIEWTDVSWNPVRGCSLVSAGCANCYAMKQAHRFSRAGQPYEGLTELGPHGPRWTGKVTLVPEALDEPLRWKGPRKVFVNSMSDLFHDDIPDEFIERVFAVMALARRHTFQVLTKRPERMRQFYEGLKWERLIDCANQNVNGGSHGVGAYSLASTNGRSTKERFVQFNEKTAYRPLSKPPMPNVWLGVSIEDQQTADARIPILLETPAAVRFVSAEPLLRLVDLEAYLSYHGRVLSHGGLDWVIVGGESGPGSRPCDVGWIRSITAQCQEGGVPVFVKQLGSNPFVIEGSRAAQDWSALGASGVMDDCGGIHTKDKKGGDMDEWPEDLRVREFPR